MWQTERGTALGLPLRGASHAVSPARLVSYTPRSTWCPDSRVVSVVCSCHSLCPKCVSISLTRQAPTASEAWAQVSFLPGHLESPDWTNSCAAWPLEEPTTISPSVCPPPLVKAQQERHLIPPGSPCLWHRAEPRTGGGNGQEIRDENKTVSGG